MSASINNNRAIQETDAEAFTDFMLLIRSGDFDTAHSASDEVKMQISREIKKLDFPSFAEDPAVAAYGRFLINKAVKLPLSPGYISRIELPLESDKQV